jgi:hypothetical protein
MLWQEFLVTEEWELKGSTPGQGFIQRLHPESTGPESSATNNSAQTAQL